MYTVGFKNHTQEYIQYLVKRNEQLEQIFFDLKLLFGHKNTYFCKYQRKAKTAFPKIRERLIATSPNLSSVVDNYFD